MNDEDVTPVTCNPGYPLARKPRRTIPPEVKLLCDFAGSAALFYYVTHPDCLDSAGETVKRYWSRIVHHVSVWAARQEIRSLPETEDN